MGDMWDRASVFRGIYVTWESARDDSYESRRTRLDPKIRHILVLINPLIAAHNMPGQYAYFAPRPHYLRRVLVFVTVHTRLGTN